MNLYLVRCKGMTGSFGGNHSHGVGYVVANNSDEAYKKLRKYLDEKDFGFCHERTLDSVCLIAEDMDYPYCGIKLFL